MCLKSFTSAIISMRLFLVPPVGPAQTPASCGLRDLSSPSSDSGVLTPGPLWESLRDDFWMGTVSDFFLSLCCILRFLR